jgi:hypothetical protein
MKKIYYLLAFVIAAATFSACNPLDKTYKEMGSLPTPSGTPQTLSVTLASADYALLPTGNYAKTALSFKSQADAATNIPTILTSKYPNYASKSTASVTYNAGTVSVADSLITDISYTATPADYATILGANPKYLELTTAQAIQFLTNKYKTSSTSPNQEVMFTYIYYESGITSAAITVTDTFILVNGTWIKAYTISSAQFTSIGNAYGDFSSTDGPLINTYLGAILKADLSVTAKAQVGDVKYVSYKYYNSKNFQRVQPLTFDGTNWVGVATLSFINTNGIWAADPTIYYTVGGVGSADLTLIKNSGIGGTTLASDLASTVKYGDFDTYWVSLAPGATNVWLNQAFVLILTANFPAPKVNVPYKINFPYYTGGKDVTTTYSFTYNGTAWVAGQ